MANIPPSDAEVDGVAPDATAAVAPPDVIARRAELRIACELIEGGGEIVDVAMRLSCSSTPAPWSRCSTAASRDTTNSWSTSPAGKVPS